MNAVIMFEHVIYKGIIASMLEIFEIRKYVCMYACMYMHVFTFGSEIYASLIASKTHPINGLNTIKSAVTSDW